MTRDAPRPAGEGGPGRDAAGEGVHGQATDRADAGGDTAERLRARAARLASVASPAAPPPGGGRFSRSAAEVLAQVEAVFGPVAAEPAVPVIDRQHRHPLPSHRPATGEQLVLGEPIPAPSRDVRRLDPPTSHAAAAAARAVSGRLLRAVLLVIESAGPYGLTADEVAARLPGEGIDSVSRRVSDLAAHHLIVDTGTTRTTRRGRQARVWVAASHAVRPS